MGVGVRKSVGPIEALLVGFTVGLMVGLTV